MSEGGYALFDENGHLQQYVQVEPGAENDIELPPGWTLRDSEGAVVEFEAQPSELAQAVEKFELSFKEFMDAIWDIGAGG